MKTLVSQIDLYNSISGTTLLTPTSISGFIAELYFRSKIANTSLFIVDTQVHRNHM